MRVVIDNEFNAELFWQAIDWLNNADLEEPQEVPEEIREMVLALNKAAEEDGYRPLVEDVE